jgi:Domain of unknown function (DUF1905)/Bacteriocin-protection, YdeI or OmpD-Associated
MKFQAQIQLDGKTATGVRVPDEIVAALGPSKRPPVRVTIGDYTYRSSVVSMGGVFMLGISAEVRQRTGVAAGDEIEVDLELDKEPREVTVPSDLGAALDGNGDAMRLFDGLSYSNKRRIVMSIEGAKTAETRQRRIEKAINSLSAGKVP